MRLCRWRAPGISGRFIPPLLGLAQVKHALDNNEAALSVLDEVKAPAQPDLPLPIAAYRARLLVEPGKDEAIRWVQESGLSAGTEPDLQNVSVLLEIARLLATFNRVEEATLLAGKVIQAATQKGTCR